MLIEFGNHAAHRSIDGAPSLTAMFFPEADEHGLGGYTHAKGALKVSEFVKHRQEAMDYRDGITNLPDHEILLSVASAWGSQSREKPRWVKVIDTPGLTPKGVSADVENFLREFYGCDKEKPGNVEDMYWTRFGPPGQGGPVVPDLRAMFTNDGRTQQGNNYGGGQVGAVGQASASSATTLTTTTTSGSLNAFSGYRVYATTSTTNMVFGNIVSNTNGANTVLTVDRWYAVATPGGAAGTTPTATATYVIADGGVVSGWFMGLTTTNITPAATDHSLSGEYTTAGGGFIRKIAPYALTSGTSPMTYTLIPVFTANGSDTLPSTFYATAAFTSMMVANTTLAMKFETSLNASATIAAVGDQVTLTETVTGS